MLDGRIIELLSKALAEYSLRNVCRAEKMCSQLCIEGGRKGWEYLNGKIRVDT
jgi:hypothetical protein